MRHLRPLLPLLVLAACGVYRASPERPGLGTAWGETRSSPVRRVSFDRADPGTPTAVATLHYDDRAGLRAMLGELALHGERGGSRREKQEEQRNRAGRDWGPDPDPDPKRYRGGACPGSGPDLCSSVPPVYSPMELLGGALGVRLLDGRGAPLPLFQRRGEHFVEGREGERYVIEIENRSGVRFEAVATVDGLDVMDGDRGSFAKRGYLIEPGGRLRIDGFRRSLDDVAAFRFGPVSESYAARQGDDGNVGVIGVAFFCERGAAPPWLSREAERRLDADPFPGRFVRPPY